MTNEGMPNTLLGRPIVYTDEPAWDKNNPPIIIGPPDEIMHLVAQPDMPNGIHDINLARWVKPENIQYVQGWRVVVEGQRFLAVITQDNYWIEYPAEGWERFDLSPYIKAAIKQGQQADASKT